MKLTQFLILIIFNLFIGINYNNAQKLSVNNTLEKMQNENLRLFSPTPKTPCTVFGVDGPAHYDQLNLAADREKEKNHRYGDTWARTLRFRGKFSNNCEYDLGNSNQLDWNKLMSIQWRPNTNADKTSIRLGWRWSVAKQKMELGLYGHIKHTNKKIGREFLYLTEVALDNNFDAELILSGAGLGIMIGNKGSFIKREDIFDEGKVKTAYRRNAYFGGQECPPHIMKIRVEHIRGDKFSNWGNGACEKTFSRSVFYDYDNLTISAASKIVMSEQVYKGQYKTGESIPVGYSAGDEIPWFESEGERYVNVNSGSTLILEAGNEITLLPGFSALASSNFSAIISPWLSCSSFVSRMASLEDDSDDDNLDSLTSNEDIIFNHLDLTVFPNPSTGIFKLKMNNEEGYPKQITIYNSVGQTIYNIENPNSFEYEFNLLNESPGIYLINVYYNDFLISKKIIKE